MSGIEAVKIIVNAEKEAARIVEEAQSKATQIRKGIDLRIQDLRQQTFDGAKKEAAEIVKRAEEEGKVEAVEVTREAEKKIQELVTKASAKKNTAVDHLVGIILPEGK
jgi:vacuolar-type H+-ATPase subunit H